jgi:hypothetical protein
LALSKEFEMSFGIGDRVLNIGFEDQGIEAIPGLVLEGPKNSTLIAALANEEGSYRVEFKGTGTITVTYDNVPAANLVADTIANRVASADRVADIRFAAQERATWRRGRIAALKGDLTALEREERFFGQD